MSAVTNAEARILRAALLAIRARVGRDTSVLAKAIYSLADRAIADENAAHLVTRQQEHRP